MGSAARRPDNHHRVLNAALFTETGTIKAEGHDEVVWHKAHVIMVGAERFDGLTIAYGENT